MTKTYLGLITLLLISAACSQIKTQPETKENPFRKRQVEQKPLNAEEFKSAHAQLDKISLVADKIELRQENIRLLSEVADLKEKLATSDLGFKHDRDMIRLLIEDRLKMVEIYNLLRRAVGELKSGQNCKYENTIKELTAIGRTLAMDPMK